MQDIEKRINVLIHQMTLEEKAGQMSQIAGDMGDLENIKDTIRKGKAGSVINAIGVEQVNEFQRIAVNESRLGIPLIIGRDVIHGYKTILPIPLGQAASWNPELVKVGARISAIEAAADGIRWTFAPMIDISRDPRWGRIAESLGEDPYLASVLGSAMIEGFQNKDLTRHDSVAACAKHFAGYGYSESGKDYAAVDMSEPRLRNVVLPPFKEAVKAKAATFMTSFSEINGIPASASEFLMKDILRNEWGFEGFIVSDWDAIIQLVDQGFSETKKDAAFAALNAGVDMEMVSQSYADHLESLINESRIGMELIDECVRNILRVKFQLGLFDDPFTNPQIFSEPGSIHHLDISRQAATESCVLLKNEKGILPLEVNKIKNLAIIGPLADEPSEQLGTWVFDAIPEWAETPLQAIRKERENQFNIHYAKGLDFSRSKDRSGFPAAVEAGRNSDVILLFLGEEAILSGEAHCRADIDLPGIQDVLVSELAKLGKPMVLIFLAGRPLTIQNTLEFADAALYAWHPGTMGGPAIADILFGKASPSGKLPVTFPKLVGQIPIYYAQKKSGRPTAEKDIIFIDDIPIGAPQTSLGNTTFHQDAGVEPLFPFGYGLSYGRFEYSKIAISKDRIRLGESFEVYVDLMNAGQYEATEISQLYISDLFASLTRPVKELKKFQRHTLKPGEIKSLQFILHTDELGFYNGKNIYVTETGKFEVFIGADSNTALKISFEIIA